MRLGEYRAFGTFPVVLTSPGTPTQVLFSGPARAYWSNTTSEDVYSSYWTQITNYAQVQSILASINLTGPQYQKYQQLMVAYDQSGVSFYGLYGSMLPPAAIPGFPLPGNGVVGQTGATDPCCRFHCLFVRGDIPWWGNSGSLLAY